jgi:RecG-like helicase
MPEEQQFKRNVAYKLRISDILGSRPVISNERFSFLDFNGERVVRVNIVGSIVDKYDSEGEKRYSFLTLDDGSGQIKMKAFGDDIDRLKDTSLGQTVVVIGSLRHFNNEIYISPEIVREQNPRYLLIRKMEIEGRKQSAPAGGNGQYGVKKDSSPIDIRKSVLDMIKGSEAAGGIETAALVKSLGKPQDMVNDEIKKLLEEGIIFEPRPGKVRWLG